MPPEYDIDEVENKEKNLLYNVHVHVVQYTVVVAHNFFPFIIVINHRKYAASHYYSLQRRKTNKMKIVHMCESL